MDQGNDPDSGIPSTPRLARRRRTVLAIAVGAGLMSVGGLVGSTFVQSPSQAAADTKAPRASTITAPVTRQVLRSTLVLRGTFAEEKTVQVTPTSVASTANNPGGASLVVTGVFAAVGQQVRAGKPLLQYSGRPVFLLPGKIPAYRDLLPGETGQDVTQLQKALASLGYRIGNDTAGTFGAGTQSALSRLYRAMGYAVPTTGQSTASAVKTAQQRVDQLRSSLKTAESSAVTGIASNPSMPAGETSPSLGDSADGKQASGGDTASLKEQLTSAEQALAQARAVDGPMLPASEVVFVPSLPVRVLSIPVAVGDSVKGPVLTLSHGGLQLTGMLDPNDGPIVKPGMAVQVLDESSGVQVSGTIGSIGALVAPGDATSNTAGGTADSTGADAQGAQSVNGGAAYLPLTIKPSGTWNQSLAGQNVRITITAAASSGAVLTVPEAAITAQADTTTSVTVQGASGIQRQVRVHTGASANGLVQITPLAGGQLAAGDRVVVGQ